MPVYTKRWCDARSSKDGWRILICRYRPRALLKKDETWDIWYNQLGPSKELHAHAYGKFGHQPLNWDSYAKRYFREMKKKDSRDLIMSLAKLAAAGETITLLCSSACTEENKCHRSLLKKLIENPQLLSEKKLDLI
ncbi:MAG: DUF488 family protein [Gammaproteobacteria bacterium]|nr:DUF488 family protein [Gammaproteobacteria bacterium]